MLELVRFNCGCVGTKPVDGKSHLILPCAEDLHDFGSLALWPCQDGSKRDNESRPLGEAEYGRVIMALRNLLADGAKFRELRKLLK